MLFFPIKVMWQNVGAFRSRHLCFSGTSRFACTHLLYLKSGAFQKLLKTMSRQPRIGEISRFACAYLLKITINNLENICEYFNYSIEKYLLWQKHNFPIKSNVKTLGPFVLDIYASRRLPALHAHIYHVLRVNYFKNYSKRFTDGWERSRFWPTTLFFMIKVMCQNVGVLRSRHLCFSGTSRFACTHLPCLNLLAF